MTEELKQIYTQQKPVEVFDTVVIHYHGFPAEDGHRKYFVRGKSAEFLYDGGNGLETRLFLGMPMKVAVPELNDTQQDLKLILPFIGPEMIELLDTLAADNEHATIEFLHYIAPNQGPEAKFAPLQVTTVSIDSSSNTVMITANHKNLFDTYYLNELFDYRFRALTI